MKTALSLSWILLCVALTFAARCWNLRDVFIDGRIYFVDADCYSRMSRAQRVAEHPGAIIRHHDFENWPQGIAPHTTAPLDYVIVAGQGVLDAFLRTGETASVLRGQTLDLAGALVGPMLGVVGALFLVIWAKALRLRFWGMPLLFYALSPILVHGTVLGRPDHQALLIVLLLVALGAEVALAETGTIDPAPRVSRRAWGIVSGGAWALSLWVSLYEPLVLLVAVLALWLVGDRRAIFDRERRPGWIVFAAIVGGSFVLEGWRITAPDAATRASFELWKATIGELAHLDLASPLLLQWLGALILFVPILLVLARKTHRAAGPLLALIALVLGLTIWQIRWGYFLAVIFTLALPFAMAAVRRTWTACLAFCLALWPLAQAWDVQLFPDAGEQRAQALRRSELVELRNLVSAQTGTRGGPFLAPWWLSPPIAYWSGQPGVAGSSHESLPGILDAARVFLAADPATAEPILRARQVAWILTDAPERVVPTSATLLGVPPPPQCLARELSCATLAEPWDALFAPPENATHAASSSFFRVWRVRSAAAAANLPGQ